MLPLRSLLVTLTFVPLLLLSPLTLAADADALRNAIKQNSRDTSALLERQERLANDLDQLALDMAKAAQNNSSEAEEARLQLEIAEIDFKQNPKPQTKRVRDTAMAKYKSLGGSGASSAAAPTDINALRDKHTAITNELNFINNEVARLDGEMTGYRKSLRAQKKTSSGNNNTANRSSGNSSANSSGKSATKSSAGTASAKQNAGKSVREPARPNQPAMRLDDNFTLLLSSKDINGERQRIKSLAGNDSLIRHSKGLTIETWNGDVKSDSHYTMKGKAPGQFMAVLKLKQGLNILRTGDHRWIMDVPPEDNGAGYVFTLDATAAQPMLRCWSGTR